MMYIPLVTFFFCEGQESESVKSFVLCCNVVLAAFFQRYLQGSSVANVHSSIMFHWLCVSMSVITYHNFHNRLHVYVFSQCSPACYVNCG